MTIDIAFSFLSSYGVCEKELAASTATPYGEGDNQAVDSKLLVLGGGNPGATLPRIRRSSSGRELEFCMDFAC